MTTPLLAITELVSAQASPEITVNEALRLIEGLTIRVLSRSTTAEPGSPADGDAYIIPAAATGTDWSTFTAGDVALFSGGAWSALTPFNGLSVTVVDENGLGVYWDGAAWRSLGAQPHFVPEIVSANTTLTAADMGKLLLVDTAGGAVTITLEDPSLVSGEEVLIVKTSADANAVTVDAAAGDSIEGAGSISLASQWDKAALVSDGAATYVRRAA